MLVLLFVTLDVCCKMGNPYGIGDKFAIGGDGTGGYMALALAALDKDSEVLLLNLSILLIMLLQHMDNLFLTSFNLC